MRYLFRLITHLAGNPTCTLHWVVEKGVYPYRCSHCEGCFACEHLRLGYRWWLCPTGRLHRVDMDPGVPVDRLGN